MYKLDVSDLAHEDLNSIIRYIAEKLCAPQAAADFADEVDKTYGRLRENPFQFSLCNHPRLAREGYRRAVIKHYILVFKVDGKQVVVYRYFYGRQNYSELI